MSPRWVAVCRAHTPCETARKAASGINRDDNCGLHVIYSGTMGAARHCLLGRLERLGCV
jgi:hypothetical protein